MRLVILLLIIPVFLFGVTPKEQLKKIFEDKGDLKTYFSESFLSAVPIAKLTPVFKKYRIDCGKIITITPTGSDSFKVIGTKGSFPAKIGFDQDDKISMLWFGGLTPTNDSIKSISEELIQLKSSVSVYLEKNDHLIYTLKANQPLGVGSTFKLYILKALQQKIKNDPKLNWDSVIKLNKTDQSLPSGMLQNWATGSPVTLRTLGNMMISISDNTATDHLLSFVTRRAVEKLAPKTTYPFLKTSELFKLKWGVNQKTVQKYLKADLKTKRLILKKEIAPFPLKKIDIAKISTPTMIDQLEWFITTKEAAKILKELKGDPSIAINGGLVDIKKWYYVGYKGGSEPGVLNYTIMLQKTKKSPLYILSATINTEVLKDVKVFTPKILRIIALIEQDKI